MTLEKDLLRQQRSRIAYELRTKHEMRTNIIERLIERGVFDVYTLDETLTRLHLLHDALGDYNSGVLLERDIACFRHPIELLQRLQPLVNFLVDKGYSVPDSRRLVTVRSSLVLKCIEDITATYDAIYAYIGNARAMRVFISRKPQALLIPASHIATKTTLRWTDEIDRFWYQLVEGFDMRTVETAPDDAPQIKRLNTEERSVYARLRASGVDEDRAAKTAAKITELVDDAGPELIDAFVLEGWSMMDIIDLVFNPNNRAWVSDPRTLFKAEKTLVSALQITPEAARGIVKKRHEYLTRDLAPIQAAADAFRAAQFADNLTYIARVTPNALFLPSDVISRWLSDKKRCTLHSVATLVKKERRKQANGAVAEEHPTPTPVPKPEPVATPVVKPAPPSVKPLPAVPRSIRPLPLKQRVDVVEEDDDEEDDEEDGSDARTDNHIRNWDMFIRAVLELTHDLRADGQRKFRHDQKWESWSKDPKNQLLGLQPDVIEALKELTRWTNTNEKPGKFNATVYFYGRLLRERELRPILHTPREALHFRMAAVRLLLNEDFISQPELLLHEFEKHAPAELRYRLNQPYSHEFSLQGLLALTRQEFDEMHASIEAEHRQHNTNSHFISTTEDVDAEVDEDTDSSDE